MILFKGLQDKINLTTIGYCARKTRLKRFCSIKASKVLDYYEYEYKLVKYFLYNYIYVYRHEE